MQQELRRLMHSDLALKLPLNRLAAVCGLSVRHFTRLFRSRTGVSPHRYLMQVRLSTARRLLLESDMPLHEVALACGFADQSHFTRAFSAVQTLSPAAWRRLHAPAAKR